MSILKRQSIKSTIYTYIGVVIGFIYTGILMPNFLDESEIGALNLILAYSLIFSQLGSFGFHSTTIRIFPYFKDPNKKHNGFLGLSTLVSLVGFVVVAILYYTFKPWLVSKNIDDSPIFANYFYLILPITIFTIVYNQFDSYARALYYSTIGTFLKEFFQRILILVVILLFMINLFNQTGLFIAYSIAIIAPTFFIAFFLMLKNEFRLSLNFDFLKKDLVKEMTRMCVFGIITGFGALAIAQIDRLMINHYLSESETGIYSVTFYFGALVMMPSRAVQRIAASMIAAAFKENDLKSIKEMYDQTCLYQFMLSLILFLLLWLNIDDIFSIIPPEYNAGKYVVFFIGLANVIVMLGGTSSSIITSSSYYSYSAWFVGLYLVIIVITNMFFIPIFGISGAAAASALSTLIYIFLQFLFVYKIWGFQPYNLKYVYLLLISGLIFLFFQFISISMGHFIINILLNTLIIVALFASLVYLSNISSDLNLYAKNFIKRLK